MDQKKFDAFERMDYTYSTVKGHPIEASVWWLKKATPRESPRRPLLVFFHGGGYITGHRLFEPWWPTWLIELATDEDAIIVAPDFRLLPEATLLDIFDDSSMFLTWFKDVIPVLAEDWPVQPNYNRVLCCGQSAGATLALQAAILRPDISVTAIITMCGTLYDDISFFNVPSARSVFGFEGPPARQAELIIRSHIRKTKGTIRTQGHPLEDLELTVCMSQQAWLKRTLHADKTRQVHSTLEMLSGSKGLPPTWFIHGAQDQNVPPICTTEFVKRYLEEVPAAQPHLTTIRDGDHIFDISLSMKDEPWILEGCDFVLDYW